MHFAHDAYDIFENVKKSNGLHVAHVTSEEALHAVLRLRYMDDHKRVRVPNGVRIVQCATGAEVAIVDPMTGLAYLQY